MLPIVAGGSRRWESSARAMASRATLSGVSPSLIGRATRAAARRRAAGGRTRRGWRRRDRPRRRPAALGWLADRASPGELAPDPNREVPEEGPSSSRDIVDILHAPAPRAARARPPRAGS